MIPSGLGGAYHSLTAGNNVDANSTADASSGSSAKKARWNPTETTAITPPGESIAADPDALAALGFDRACLSTGSLNAADESQGYNFFFQNTDAEANAQIDEQPSSLYMEFEVFVDWDQSAPSGSDQWLFLALTDTSGRAAKFINYVPGGVPTTGLTNFATSMGLTLKNAGTAWTMGQWYTVRIRYVASSNPGTTTDGAIYWYAAPGSAGNGDSLTFTDQFSGGGGLSAHFGGALRSFSPFALNVNAYTKACNTWWRNFYWSTTLPAGAAGNGMTDSTPWFSTYALGKPHIGAQDQGTTGIKVRCWSKYDRNQFAQETTNLSAVFQWKYTTDADTWATIRGTSATQTVNLTANAVDQYIAAGTIDDVPENTSIDVRVRWNVDPSAPGGVDGFDFFTAKSTFTTVSRLSPTIIKIVSGSCTPHSALITPFSGYDVIKNDAPHLVLHGGDVEYMDSSPTTGYSDPAGYVAIGATTAARQAIVKQYIERQVFNNCQFDKIASYSSCTIMPDDHDWINGFGGLSTTPTDYTSGDGATLRDEIEAIHRQYYGCRTFNYNPGEAASTVHYHRMRTCKCDILSFDCRRHNDLSTSPIGATQLGWARTIIQATTKPILVLVSTVPWHSLDGAGGGADAQENWSLNSFTDRNLLLADAQSNPAIVQVVLISSDRHYVSINKSEFASYNKVRLGDLCVSPLNQLARAYTEDTSTTVFQSQFGKTTSQCARGYLLVSINENSLAVVAEVKGLQGSTTQSSASTLYAESQGGSGGNMYAEWWIRRRLAKRRREREEAMESTP